jgi:hypothetical protein
MGEVLRVMKETQCISRTAIGESRAIDERGASLEGVANLWWDHHIGISRVTNPDRHLAGNKFPVYTIIDEISCRGVKSSRSHSRLDAVKSGEGSGTETKHERRLITGEMRTGCLLNCESSRV